MSSSLSHSPFGDDAFGRGAEKVARFFGTPRYIVVQTFLVLLWIAFNSFALISHWDPYPFILLNLAFSTQAAYAAPLILLAQTRQADRDKVHTDSIEKRHTDLERASVARTVAIKRETDSLKELLEANTKLTQQDKELTEKVAALTQEIHALLKQRDATS